MKGYKIQPIIDAVVKNVCVEISKRYEIRFLEIGTEGDHVHFLVQSVPTYSPTKIVTKIKSIIAREIFSAVPSVKEQLWGGEFWTDGYLYRLLANMRTKMLSVNTSRIRVSTANINNCTNKR